MSSTSSRPAAAPQCFPDLPQLLSQLAPFSLSVPPTGAAGPTMEDRDALHLQLKARWGFAVSVVVGSTLNVDVGMRMF